MTRLVRVSLVALCLLSLFACQNLGVGSGQSATSTRIHEILERGELRVGLSGGQPPLNVKNRRGEVIGLEADLVRALADAMRVDVRFVVTPFPELLSALEGGDVDIVISGMTITPERNARVAFAGPYLISGKSLLTKSEVLANAEGPEALDHPSRKYVAMAGSTSEEFVRDLLPKAELLTTSDYDKAIEMVLKDEVDAMIADFPICALSVLRYPDAGLMSHRNPFTIEPLGIALPADDPLLVNLVQNYLRMLEDTGILTGLKAKWFSKGDWISELP